MSLIIFLQETMVDYGAFAAIGAGLAAIGACIILPTYSQDYELEMCEGVIT